MSFDDSLSGLHAALCVLLLMSVGVLTWQRKGQQAMICATLLLNAQYMIWRGLYTLNATTWEAVIISWTVYLAELYGTVQLVFFAFQVWKPSRREAPTLRNYRTVDIFVPIVNEPLPILRRTLVSCLNQHYPKNKYQVCVLDDGHREDVQNLATSLGCVYLRRGDRVHAKAGNLNHALEHTNGDLIAVFDTDHAPAANFLTETVGFFEEETVAFVQTPQHFYNADIFQKNLYLEKKIPNEQALFFRVIQPGRDRHNSAFFAGSGGVFRRKVLAEVGGFQTATITEDLHTSVLVHSRGYQSRYVNKPLAAGLMPETFESFLKQRARWATGTWQMFFRTSLGIVRGLTWPQRMNYLASVWYFGFGIPRLICLIAPLFGLMLHVSPVNASLWELSTYYGAYLVASLLMMKTVSRGIRVAFWSEVYEIAMCFRTSWAVVTTILQPYAVRPFVITPKGLQQDRRHFAVRPVLPHVITSALLLLGVGHGLLQWLNQAASPGIQITIAWGAVNLLFLCVTIAASIDPQQWRKFVRVPRRLRCTLMIERKVYDGTSLDLSESGALIQIPTEAMMGHSIGKDVVLTLPGPRGSVLTVKCKTRTQRPASGKVTVGVEFIDVDDKTADALIVLMFGDDRIWNEAVPDAGIWKNIWWLLSAIRVPFLVSRVSFRRTQRFPCHYHCEGLFSAQTLNGTVMNISKDGLMAQFIGTSEHLSEEGNVRIGHCVLHVKQMWSSVHDDKVLAGFRIESIKEGERHWRLMLHDTEQRLLSKTQAA